MKRKDIMLGRLNELLLPLGYEHITTPGINGFFKVYPDYVDLFTLGFYMRLDIVDIIFSRRSFPEVAVLYNQIFEKTRYHSWAWRSKKIAITPTIVDRETEKKGVGNYPQNLFSANYCKWLGLDTEEALFDFCDWIAFHLENEESEFSKHYKTLPSVLEKMDELDAKGIFWGDSNLGILPWGSGAHLSGLIISKLCNDLNFLEKYERIEAYLSKDENEEWLPYFEKLKEILEHVEPRYNV